MDWGSLVNAVRTFLAALLGYLGGSSVAENAAQKAALDTARAADEVRTNLSAVSGDDARQRLHGFDRE